MLDPLAIATGVGSLIGNVSSIITTCNNYRQQYGTSSVALKGIIDECEFMKAALARAVNLFDVNQQRYRGREEIVNDFQIRLAGCERVVDVLEEELTSLWPEEARPGNEPSRRIRARFVWNEAKIQEIVRQLRGQRDGLTFMVSILQT
jgi:hypothetical protein